MSQTDVIDPSPEFIDNVLGIVNTIPPGRVMTYGDIAAEVTSRTGLDEAAAPLGARLVGSVMARFGSDVAWWRVVRANGQPPKFHEEQAWALYLEEGTPLTGSRAEYRIDLARARFQPHADADGQSSLGLF